MLGWEGDEGDRQGSVLEATGKTERLLSVSERRTITIPGARER